MENNELNLEQMEQASGGAGKVKAGGLKEKPAEKPGYVIHKITATDNLTRIANKYNTTINAILACNPSIKDKNLIRTGYYIYVPKK